MVKQVSTAPKPRIILALQNQNWTVQGALAEFIDNSFGAARGNAKNVWIARDKEVIEILDDGIGIPKGVVQLFQLGATAGHGVGDIGRYGSGGTMAAVWLGAWVQVYTLVSGKLNFDVVDWNEQIHREEFPMVSDEWVRATPANTPHSLFNLKHGTLVRVCLKGSRKLNPDVVRAELASIFAPALRHGRHITWQSGGASLVLTEHRPEMQEIVKINFTLLIGAGLPVTGEIGYIPDYSQDKSRVSFGFGHRRIFQSRDCYVGPDGKRYAAPGVLGYIDLGEGWQEFLTTTKDEINDDEIREALMAVIFERIKPLLEKIDEQEKTIHINDIAVQLEQALNGRKNVTAKVGDKPGEIEILAGIHGDGDGPPPNPDPDPGPNTTKREPGDKDANKKAATSITLLFRSDHQMDRLLASCQANPDSIVLFVNKDHELVQLALESKPVNRAALHALITPVMVGEVIDHAQLYGKVFPASERALLDARGTSSERLHFATRLLLDRSDWKRVA